MTEKLKSEFLKQVADHQLVVVHENGVHRDLSFRNRNGSNHYHVGVVTWPGYLCVYGDIGTWVWRRVHDMIPFFAGDCIRPCYWAEKIAGVHGHVEEFDPEATKARVMELALEHNKNLCHEERQEFADYLNGLMGQIDDGESYAICAIQDYHPHGFEIDLIDDNPIAYRFKDQYLLCCVAVQHVCNLYQEKSFTKCNQELLK